MGYLVRVFHILAQIMSEYPFNVDLKPPPLDKHLATLRRSIRILLTRRSLEILPTTYERLYSMCRSVVTISEAGSSLYNILKMELDQCVKGIESHLLSSEKLDVEWISELNQTFKWFNSQIVSKITNSHGHTCTHLSA